MEHKAKLDALETASAAVEGRPTMTLPRQPAGDGFLVEGMQPPFPAAVFLARNHWLMENRDGTRLVVWAGLEGAPEGSPRAQGGVRVLWYDATGFRLVGSFPTPTKRGAVRITGAVGRVLDLEADDGTRFQFDVDSRRFK